MVTQTSTPRGTVLTLVILAAGGALALAGLFGAGLSLEVRAGVMGGLFLVMLGAVMLQVRQMARQRAEIHRLDMVRDAYDAAVASHLVTRPDGTIAYANGVAAKLLDLREGARIDGIAGKLEDEGSSESFARLNAAAIHCRTYKGEFAVFDGAFLRTYEARVRPLANHGRAVHWRIEDVTERREVEAAMRDEQAKLTDFMDWAPVGFYSVDEDGRFHFANSTLARWLGLDSTELTRGGFRLHDFLAEPPADAPPFAIDAADPFADQVETAMRSRTGRVLQVSVSQEVTQGEDGSVWTRSVVRDHTHMRQIREALRVSEARFKHFFDAAPIGLALVDRDGRLNEWNPAFETMFTGIAEIEAGMPVARLVDQDNKRDFLARLRDSINKRDTDAPFEFRTPGEDHRAAAVFARHLDAADGGAPGVILQFIDQTDQKNLEQRFVQSQKMQAIGQLAGGIAHDFNNLLTAMIGFCDLLLQRHRAGDPSFTDIMQIKQNANRAANLVRQLLAFSRQQTLQPRLLNVTDTLAELSHLLQRLIGENMELEMVHGRDLGRVMVDAGQLEQVIVNLAVNARDAMPDGGKLSIDTGSLSSKAPLRLGNDDMPAGDYVYIRIGDTGTGIAEDNLSRIFDPFFSTKEIGKGTGLGLSTVYGIVRQTGGYVQVSSTVGKGTEFTIYLPVAQEAAQPAEALPEPAKAAARDLTGVGNILLVEDEDPVRLFSARALRNKGYEVIEARSGMEALEKLAEQPDKIDLLITDVVMPEIDGPTLIVKARESMPDLKVICISGYTEDRFRPSDIEGAPVHFLAKPFSLQQLASKVKDVVLQA